MALTVLVPLADGFEEIEAVTTIDILRRAGFAVTTAGFGKASATGSHAITVQTDVFLEQARAGEYDVIALPGGPGTKTLADNAELTVLLRKQSAAGRWIAAICAAPSVLAKAGLLEGKRATCFPSAEKDMAGARLSREEVVVDGKVITSRGAGTAVLFALRIVEEVLGAEKADQLAEQIIFRSRA